MAEQKTIGQIAYEAWFGSLSLKDGKTPMDWPGDMHKDDWEAAASAVWDKAVDACAKELENRAENHAQIAKDHNGWQQEILMAKEQSLAEIVGCIRSLKRSDKTEKADG